ncbi:MAG: hypothetical protein ACREYE_29130 [Gammaproteobacteria bacterium]
MKKPTALGISRALGARNPHVFQYTLRFLRSGGTRPPFARDGFFHKLSGLKPQVSSLKPQALNASAAPRPDRAGTVGN